jgi:tRNA(fMet)-specific endonuclease VapC
LIAPYPCLPFDKAAADQFATIRRHLESLGALIGPYDLQIAAIALTNGCTLVTHNLAEFQRVPRGQAVPDFVAYNLNWKTRIHEPRSIEHRRCDRSL